MGLTRRDFDAARCELPLFQQGRDAATKRLNAARNMCDAVANQDYAIQAEATTDLEDAIAVASEWGLVRMSPGV